jgi:hypothetical protein
MRAVIHPVAQLYFDAVAAGNAEALAQAFVQEGTIIDVGRTISGRDAIRSWAVNEVIGGHYEVLEISPYDHGQIILLKFTPPGSRSGLLARYIFTFDGNSIAAANLQYA